LVVGFDQNVTNKLVLPENLDRVDRMMRRVQAGEIEFVATQELIEEACAVVETKDPGRLREFGRVIGALTHGKHLNTSDWVVQTELTGNAEAFAPEKDRESLLGLLDGAASGGAAIAGAGGVARTARRKREDAVTRWKALNDLIRREVESASDAERKRLYAMTFEDVDRENWNKWGRSMGLRRAQEAGAADPEAVADRVMADPTSYPFTRRFMAVFSVLRWWWTVRQRRTHEGDQNDARQLVMFPVLDHFVTNDKAIRAMSLGMGDPEGMVVTFEEFFQ
jgi:hypothetical protein